MIVNRNNKSYDFYTEGFGISFPEPFSIKVASGKLCFFNNDGETCLTYPEFEFDVIADTELPVMYNVYLLEDDVVHVDRTELLEDTVAFYEGEAELQHTLLYFRVEPNTVTLDDTQLNFNNVEVILP